MKKEGVPVLDKVADSLFAIWPRAARTPSCRVAQRAVASGVAAGW